MFGFYITRENIVEEFKLKLYRVTQDLNTAKSEVFGLRIEIEKFEFTQQILLEQIARTSGYIKPYEAVAPELLAPHERKTLSELHGTLASLQFKLLNLESKNADAS